MVNSQQTLNNYFENFSPQTFCHELFILKTSTMVREIFPDINVEQKTMFKSAYHDCIIIRYFS